MEESPDAAAQRVARDWAGIRGASPQLVAVTSELFPTGRSERAQGTRRGIHHWALCLIYEWRADRVDRRPPGWQELRFVWTREARRLPIGRGHADLLDAWRKAKRRRSGQRSRAS